MDDGFSAEKMDRASEFFFTKKKFDFAQNRASEEAPFKKKTDFPQKWGERFIFSKKET